MNDISTLQSIPLFVWILIAIILLAQGSWIFYDAAKRGEKKWLWGFFGLLNFPSSLLIYLLVTRAMLKTKPCSDCGYYMKESSRYCPNCGRAVEE